MRILIDGQTVVWKQARLSVWKPGLQAQHRSRRFLGGAGIGCLTTLGVGVVFFLSDSRCPMLKWYNFF